MGGNVQRVIKDEKPLMELIIWALKVADLLEGSGDEMECNLAKQGRPLITAAQASMGGL